MRNLDAETDDFLHLVAALHLAVAQHSGDLPAETLIKALVWFAMGVSHVHLSTLEGAPPGPEMLASHVKALQLVIDIIDKSDIMRGQLLKQASSIREQIDAWQAKQLGAALTAKGPVGPYNVN